MYIKIKKPASHYGGDLNERITKLIVWLKRDVHEINHIYNKTYLQTYQKHIKNISTNIVLLPKYSVSLQN